MNKRRYHFGSLLSPWSGIKDSTQCVNIYNNNNICSFQRFTVLSLFFFIIIKPLIIYSNLWIIFIKPCVLCRHQRNKYLDFMFCCVVSCCVLQFVIYNNINLFLWRWYLLMYSLTNGGYRFNLRFFLTPQLSKNLDISLWNPTLLMLSSNLILTWAFCGQQLSHKYIKLSWCCLIWKMTNMPFS